MLRMMIEGVGLDHQKQTVVLLKDWEGRKLLPIWIGTSEARSIALELDGARPERPFAHDILLQCIKFAGGHITRVVINDLQDSTFYATIDIDTPQGLKHIDSRPSDAIACAVRAKCPVFVDGEAMKALIEMDEVMSVEANAADASEEQQSVGDIVSSQAGAVGDEEEISRFKRLIGDLDV